MEFNLLRLRNGLDQYIPVDLTYSFSKEQIQDTDLLELNNIKITGEISKNAIDEIAIDLDVDGVMVLPCAVTLKPVNYPFHIKISGTSEELLDEMDENIKKDENTLDIFPIIWENILMEIPMRVVSEDADLSKLNGDGWKVIDEHEENVNPELAKLKDLL